MTMPHPAASRLRAHVEMLAGTIGERNLWRCEALDRAARYISAQFSSAGYAPEWQTFDVAKIPVSNVEATLTGAAHAAEIVVVGAHYDTVAGCPGANDNGTGVAAVLELAQRFSGRPAAAHDPLRGVRQRRAAVLQDRTHGQRRLCQRGERSRRSDHGDAGAGDDGLLLGREREPAVPGGDRIALPGRRRLHRVRREQRFGAAAVAVTSRHSSSGRDFRCRPSQPLTMSPASAGRITGRSGRLATRR